MRTVTMTCERGGVGKTSVTVALAEAAARKGVSTLVVDLDPQANATRRLLGVPESGMDWFAYEGPSVLDVLTADRRAAAESAVVESGEGWPAELLLLASPGAGLLTFEQQTMSLHDRRLNRGLAGIDRHGIELVLIDTAPSLGLLTQNGLTAANDLLVVAHVLGSRQGVAETIRAVEPITEEYEAAIAGLVLTEVPSSSRDAATRAALSEWQEVWGERLLAMIPRSSVWTTAERDARPLGSYQGEFGRSAPAASALAAASDVLVRLDILTEKKVNP